MTDLVILACIAAVIGLNLLVVILGRGHAAHREQAVRQAPNVVVLVEYRRGQLLDRVA